MDFDKIKFLKKTNSGRICRGDYRNHPSIGLQEILQTLISIEHDFIEFEDMFIQTFLVFIELLEEELSPSPFE